MNEVGLPDSSETEAAPVVEPWTQHHVSAGICAVCSQSWPCDIAKAWRGGYEWAETKQRLRELHEQLGARNGA